MQVLISEKEVKFWIAVNVGFFDESKKHYFELIFN